MEQDIIKSMLEEIGSERIDKFKAVVREKLKAIQAQQVVLATAQAQIVRLQQELKALKLETFDPAQLTG